MSSSMHECMCVLMCVCVGVFSVCEHDVCVIYVCVCTRAKETQWVNSQSGGGGGAHSKPDREEN